MQCLRPGHNWPADIWVANESHCIKEGFPVRNELVDWLSQQPSYTSATSKAEAATLAAQHIQ